MLGQDYAVCSMQGHPGSMQYALGLPSGADAVFAEKFVGLRMDSRVSTWAWFRILHGQREITETNLLKTKTKTITWESERR